MSSIYLQYSLQSILKLNDQEFDLKPLLLLLNALNSSNNLRSAAMTCNFSYRKAWNLLQQFEEIFTQPLVEKQRGKGSKLSTLGLTLINLEKDNKVTLINHFNSAEIKANKILHPLLSQAEKLKIIASDSEKLNALRQQALNVEIETEGSGQALAAFADGKCEIAGFHIVTEQSTEKQFANYAQYFDPENDLFFLLEHRQQGLISHPAEPVNSLHQIVNKQLTFVNRQLGSGTRLLLENLLVTENIKPEQIKGYFHEEHTHLAVASVISSRQADAGLGVESAAKKLKLHFRVINHELYFLVFKQLNPNIQFVLEKLSAQQPVEIINYKTFLDKISLKA